MGRPAEVWAALGMAKVRKFSEASAEEKRLPHPSGDHDLELRLPPPISTARPKVSIRGWEDANDSFGGIATN